MRILTYCGAYLPGYKAGGPLRSIAGLVKHLGRSFEFWVVTRDRDYGDTRPYPGVPVSRWTKLGDAQVYYASPAELTPWGIRRISRSAAPDVYYVNSLFDRWFSILPLALRGAGLVPPRPCVLAPRGELSPGALGLKAIKKGGFLAIARWLSIYRNVTWQASSPAEAADIQSRFPRANVVVAGNLTDASGAEVSTVRVPKRPGALSLAFVSRITPKKNLPFALRLLAQVRGDVDYHVYGPIEDQSYGERCRAEAARLPSNIRVTFHGAVAPDTVALELARHHALLLPTLGENFGHAIFEALLAGCVAIIGDQTPWRELEQRGAGWDLPVNDSSAFVAALQRTIDMDDMSFARASANARAVATERMMSAGVFEQNRRLFRDIVCRR
jgi:glycosyltransferase involved in cell wall biosynthesis